MIGVENLDVKFGSNNNLLEHAMVKQDIGIVMTIREGLRISAECETLSLAIL